MTFCGTPVENPVDVEPIQEWQPPPPECWQGPNNCPVGQSISYAVPEYMMVGVPVNVTVYATRTVEDELGRFNYGQPDNGTAVIHYGDHESDPPVAGVPFENGQATFRVVPQEAGKKNFSICGVLNSGTSGGNAYIDCIDGETTVLPYDPETYRKAFRDLALEKGDRFTIVDADQAKGKVAKRLEWSVAQSDEDVCAVYETKKGKVEPSSTRRRVHCPLDRPEDWRQREDPDRMIGLHCSFITIWVGPIAPPGMVQLITPLTIGESKA